MQAKELWRNSILYLTWKAPTYYRISNELFFQYFHLSVAEIALI